MGRIPKCEMTEPELENVGNLIFKKVFKGWLSEQILKNSLHFFEEFFSFRDFNMNI